jgi:hypothetical protein
MHPKSKRAAARRREMNRRDVDFVARLNDTMQEAVLTGLQERLKASPLMKRGMARQFEMLQKAAAREGTPERAERLKRYCARLAAILAECGAGAEQER